MGERLSELLGDTNVQILNDCVGDEVKNTTDFMMPKDVVLLENLRFYAGEEKNDEDFAENLAKVLALKFMLMMLSTMQPIMLASTAGITKYVDTTGAAFADGEGTAIFVWGARQQP